MSIDPTPLQPGRDVTVSCPLFKIRASEAHLIMGKKGLGQTGLSYCEKWLRERMYKRRKRIDSKYFRKGNECQYEAIRMAWPGHEHNEDMLRNDWFTGTPDVMSTDYVREMKCPWDWSTFPLFKNSLEPDHDHSYQVQIYMDLMGLKQAEVCYMLMDAPVSEIDREASRRSWPNEVEMDLYDQVQAEMTYSDVPDWMKCKRFRVDYDINIIRLIKSRVMECRSVIEELYLNVWKH